MSMHRFSSCDGGRRHWLALEDLTAAHSCIRGTELHWSGASDPSSISHTRSHLDTLSLLLPPTAHRHTSHRVLQPTHWQGVLTHLFKWSSNLNYVVWCVFCIMCVCAHVVLQASVYLIPEELFKMELEEGMDRVRKAVQVFWEFKRSFQQHRDKLTPTGPYRRPGLVVKPWDFPSELVFHRIDCIMERLRMIEVCAHKSNSTENSWVYNYVFSDLGCEQWIQMFYTRNML